MFACNFLKNLMLIFDLFELLLPPIFANINHLKRIKILGIAPPYSINIAIGPLTDKLKNLKLGQIDPPILI